MELLGYIDDDTYTMFFRILIAAILCGIIGLEREFKSHPAGFRTHLLVGIGSCLMMILSLYGFEDYLTINSQFDPSRIPSYVISGIGFLGGGTILVKGATVRGLTTAASIWIVAGLGLIIGSGMYILASFTTIIVLMCLIFLNKLEEYMEVKKTRRKMKVVVQSTRSSVDEVIEKLLSYKIKTNKVVMTSCKKERDGKVTFYYQFDIDVDLTQHGILEEVLIEISEVEKIY
ncbi:MgtC/SapB family protein [Metabacillus schmidteae]|uniref:MgtC/SapB family protein n=1 Tax=Metabacillus schmidteae TaxID=2730405 RepID=UPI00158C389D|nr:MgtC/SapB family protein [Metabacillus schmidteae]